jgi:hypothetical protein
VPTARHALQADAAMTVPPRRAARPEGAGTGPVDRRPLCRQDAGRFRCRPHRDRARRRWRPAAHLAAAARIRRLRRRAPRRRQCAARHRAQKRLCLRRRCLRAGGRQRRQHLPPPDAGHRPRRLRFRPRPGAQRRPCGARDRDRHRHRRVDGREHQPLGGERHAGRPDAGTGAHRQDAGLRGLGLGRPHVQRHRQRADGVARAPTTACSGWACATAPAARPTRRWASSATCPRSTAPPAR